MLRLHHSPFACSLASRFALAEAAVVHEVVIVRTSHNEHKTEAYLRINPRAQVPALETDEGVLTESTAILPYIADLAPQKALFPKPGTFARSKAQAWLSFLSSSLHVALTAVMFPREGCDNEVAERACLSRVVAFFRDVDVHLEGREHLLESFSVCDLYLATFALWRAAPALSGKLPPFSNVDRILHDVLCRPALAPIMGEELRLRMDP